MNAKNFIIKFVLTRYWSYLTGAVLIGILNILLAIFYKPWGVTANLANLGIRSWLYLGGTPNQSLHYYFNYTEKDFFSNHLLFDESTLVNLGVILGALLSGSLASKFRLKRIKSGRQLLLGVLGGLLMGYGARLSLGCNVGALINGIASQSLHGWIFASFSFLGALTGCIIVKSFIKSS